MCVCVCVCVSEQGGGGACACVVMRSSRTKLVSGKLILCLSDYSWGEKN